MGRRPARLSLTSTEPPVIESVWFERYVAAVNETDRAKVARLIAAAETAILERLRVVTVDGGWFAERDAMANALRGLRALREDVWHWKSQQN